MEINLLKVNNTITHNTRFFSWKAKMGKVMEKFKSQVLCNQLSNTQGGSFPLWLISGWSYCPEYKIEETNDYTKLN